ncbi:TPA: hypothetical protein N0F65_000733 [Lagenidium giganteum]|uniref:FYVE-type domain-containing protein n=1 Tax=Lagenidium giganteum TaxID=4803 RepID=A0AAV2ZQM8_9STRA|nr:TPA: hypothetical protein N0F65_000733 [Lagenidium giganteum]
MPLTLVDKEKEAKKKEAEVLRANIERFVDAVMADKYSLGELLNESFSMEMLELLFKRMTSKLRSILFSRAKVSEMIHVALDTTKSAHTRTMATSFLVVGSAGNAMVSCDATAHSCDNVWNAIFTTLHQEAVGPAKETEQHIMERRKSVTELEAMIQVEVRCIEADGAKSLKESFVDKDEERRSDEEHSEADTSSPSSARSSVNEDDTAEPMSPQSLSTAVSSALTLNKDTTTPFPLTTPVDDAQLVNVFSAESANYASQILSYFAVRAQKGACIWHYLSTHSDYVDLLLANIGHDDLRTFLLHLVYSDHSEAAIESFFATQMLEKMLQKLLTFAPPRNVYERDATENTFLLLREILHAPYLTSRGVAISAKTIPLDKVTGQEEYVSICGASREMANSSLRKYTSRKVRRLVHLFMQQDERSLEQLFTQMIKELTFWSTPVSTVSDRRGSTSQGLQGSLSLLSEGHPRPSCTTMLMHLFELTETVDFAEEEGKEGGGNRALTSVGIDCLNFMCSTHMVRTGHLLLKRKLKNELQQCTLSLNCMMGLRITSQREGKNSRNNAFGEAFVHEQKGNQMTISLDEIESIESSDWHKHGFVVNVRKHRDRNKPITVSGLGFGEAPSTHQDELVRSVEYFAANTEADKEQWINLLRAAINGDLNELEIFCSDDWRSNVREYRQLRDCLITCMEKKGHELMAFLRQVVVLNTRKASGYHLWSIAKLLGAVVANESKRLDQMFVSANLINKLLKCYERFPTYTLLLGEITKILVFYFGDFKSKRSRRCPLIERLMSSDDKAILLPMLLRTFAPEAPESDGKMFLAGTDARSNLKLVVEAIRLCYIDPKTRSQTRVQSIIQGDPKWQRLLAAFEEAEGLTGRSSNATRTSSEPPARNSTVAAPTIMNKDIAAVVAKATPSQPAFQEDIINQITRPCYSSAHGFGSSFLMGDGCAFGYLFKERRGGEEWQKALVVYEYVSYKLWYFYPSEVDETHRITWKWVVPVAVRSRYTHGQDENHSSIGHHGLYITVYDHENGSTHHYHHNQKTPTRELHFSVTKLDDRDLWKDVLTNAAATIQQLSNDYNSMCQKFKKPDKKTVTHCQNCQTPFKLFRRPHACHRCGKWLCGKCTQNRKAIPEVGLMTPVRHCDACFEAAGGAKSDVEPVQLFRNSSGGESGGSITGEPLIHGADAQMRLSLTNVELYELAHGMVSPRAMMRMSRHDSIDSPTGHSYQVDELDTEDGRARFFGGGGADDDNGLSPYPSPPPSVLYLGRKPLDAMRPSRKILRAICALTFVCGAALLGLGVHVSVTAHLHASAAALAALGAIVLLLATLGMVGAGREKSGVLMLYFFVNFFLITCLFVASYAAFCFNGTLEAWVKHHWSDPMLDYMRAQPCCATYEATVQHLEARMMLMGAIGFACIALQLISMYCVVRIVTVPIVMKNMLTVINLIFVVLGAGIFAYGVTVKYHDELTAGQHWIAVLFIVVGTFVVALSVLGIIGARAKSRTILLIYILGVGACLAALLASAVGAFTLSDKLARNYDSLRTDDIACNVALSGCSNCTDVPADMVECLGVSQDSKGYWTSCTKSTPASKCQAGMTLLHKKDDQGYKPNDIAPCGKCPEWSPQDVHGYIKSGLHILGLLSAIVSLFIIVGFVGALILRKSLAGYQTDSI